MHETVFCTGRLVFEVVKKQLEICSKKINIRLRTAENECVLHMMCIGFVSMLREKVQESVLARSANVVFWSRNSPSFPKSNV